LRARVTPEGKLDEERAAVFEAIPAQIPLLCASTMDRQI
jgi:hypothetical protein